MRASTIFASAATLVSAVSAGAIPTFAKRYNVTEAWGSWDITNITVTAHNSNSGVDFQVWWDQGNSGPVRCSASGYSIDADKWYRCEVREGHADSFNFNLNQGWTKLSLSQDLYQTGAIAHLNGSAPFNVEWGYSSAGSEGTVEDFTIPVLSISTTLPNGTTTGPEYSS